MPSMTHATIADSILQITGPDPGELSFWAVYYLLVVAVMKRGWIWHAM